MERASGRSCPGPPPETPALPFSATPTPPVPATADADLLLELARRVRRAHLAPVAILWLEASRPLTFLGGQLLLVLEPLFAVLLPRVPVARLAALLADRAHVDTFLALLADDEIPPCPTPARSDTPGASQARGLR